MQQIIISLIFNLLGLYSMTFTSRFVDVVEYTPRLVILSLYVIMFCYLTIEMTVFILKQRNIIERSADIHAAWYGHIICLIGAVLMAIGFSDQQLALLVAGLFVTLLAVLLLTKTKFKPQVAPAAPSAGDDYLPNALQNIPSSRQRNANDDADDVSESTKAVPETTKGDAKTKTNKVIDFKSYQTKNTPDNTQEAQKDQKSQSQGESQTTQALRQIVQPGMKASARAAIIQQKKQDPLIGLKIGGEEIAKTISHLITNDTGVRVECALGMIGALAGYSCHTWAMIEYQSSGSANAKGAIIPIEDKAGRVYYYGNLPNQALIEDPYSVWSIVGGMAQSLSDKPLLDMDKMAKETVASVGKNFGVPELPIEHMPSDLPINYVKVLWPLLEQKINQFCETARQRPMLLGFAAGEIIDGGKATICPMLAAEIVMKCAFPMSKIGPKWLEAEYKRPY